MSISEKLIKLATSENIANDLDDDELNKIADKIKRETDIDRASMAGWLNRNDKAMEIALQLPKKKNTPWPNAANVMYPLITNGGITFAAREYPQIVRGLKVVDAAVFGKDEGDVKFKKGRRISKHMSWQLLVESDSWESDTDSLLTQVAIVGTMFKKGYYDTCKEQPVFKTCRPDHIYINNNIQSIESARRITHVVYSYLNDIIELMNSGVYKDYEADVLKGQANQYGDDIIDTQDEDAPHELLEQHRYLDLDNDGYQEPYIVTYHVPSGKILRIVARYDLAAIKLTDKGDKVKYITPEIYFIDYHYLKSPDGKFLSMGLGSLLYPINETINTIFNQLIDAGTLSNAQPILMSGMARIGAPEIQLAPGKINIIESLGSQAIQDSIMHLPLMPPSPVLMSLLELLINAGKEIAGVTEILTGQQPTQNSPATSVMALIKQGLVQYNAIHKRILQSFKKEFLLLYKLNNKYLDLDKYLKMINDPEASADDYATLDIDIRPVSDPNLASDTMRLAQAQAVYQMPEVDRRAAAMFMFEAMDISVTDQMKLIPPIDPNNPPPPPPKDQKDLAQATLFTAQAQQLGIVSHADAAKLELDMQKGQREFAISAAQAELDIEVKKSQVKVNTGLAVKHLADAEKAKKEADYVGHEPKPKSV